MTIEAVMQRMDRLEQKLDKQTELLITLSKTEQRVVQLMEADRAQSEDIRRLRDDITKLKERQSALGVWERMLWICAAAAVGGLAWWKT